MPGEPPAVELACGPDGRVCGALAVGGGSGLLWIAGEGLRETEPVTSLCDLLLRDENSLSLAKREEFRAATDQAHGGHGGQRQTRPRQRAHGLGDATHGTLTPPSNRTSE